MAVCGERQTAVRESEAMANTQHTPNSPSHGKLLVVVAAAALIIVLALLSAFVWPGWALDRNASANNGTTTSTADDGTKDTEPTTPSIKAAALPDDASELLKAMPDSVLDYARTAADTSTAWGAASPLEEYTLTYSTGDEAKDVTLVIAQWSTAKSAKAQYDAVTKALAGSELASGTVKVSGEATGSYTVHEDAADTAKAMAVWRNDTVVFQASGSTESVQRFYVDFPL